MARPKITVTIEVEVWNEERFRNHAQRRANDDGLSDAFDAQTASLAECAQMILDPGSLPGADIENSEAESY